MMKQRTYIEHENDKWSELFRRNGKRNVQKRCQLEIKWYGRAVDDPMEVIGNVNKPIPLPLLSASSSAIKAAEDTEEMKVYKYSFFALHSYIIIP